MKCNICGEKMDTWIFGLVGKCRNPNCHEASVHHKKSFKECIENLIDYPKNDPRNSPKMVFDVDVSKMDAKRRTSG